MSNIYGDPCRCSASGSPDICPRCMTCRRVLEVGEKTVCNWCEAKHEQAS